MKRKTQIRSLVAAGIVCCSLLGMSSCGLSRQDRVKGSQVVQDRARAKMGNLSPVSECFIGSGRAEALCGNPISIVSCKNAAAAMVSACKAAGVLENYQTLEQIVAQYGEPAEKA